MSVRRYKTGASPLRLKKRNLGREVLKRLGRPLEFLLCGKSVRALALLVFPGFSGPPRDLFQAGWLGPPGLPEVLVDFVAVTHLGAGISGQLPTDQAGVAAVHGIAEHAFDGVRPQELEEPRLLNRP